EGGGVARSRAPLTDTRAAAPVRPRAVGQRARARTAAHRSPARHATSFTRWIIDPEEPYDELVRAPLWQVLVRRRGVPSPPPHPAAARGAGRPAGPRRLVLRRQPAVPGPGPGALPG